METMDELLIRLEHVRAGHDLQIAQMKVALQSRHQTKITPELLELTQKWRAEINDQLAHFGRGD